jgi:hypothetical protein
LHGIADPAMGDADLRLGQGLVRKADGLHLPRATGRSGPSNKHRLFQRGSTVILVSPVVS